MNEETNFLILFSFQKRGECAPSRMEKQIPCQKRGRRTYTDRLSSSRNWRSKRIGRSSDFRQETSAFSILWRINGFLMNDVSNNRLQRRGPSRTWLKIAAPDSLLPASVKHDWTGTNTLTGVIITDLAEESMPSECASRPPSYRIRTDGF